LKLLTALYSPSSGAILIDGTDNGEIDPADLRNNVRLVASDNTLFYGSVKDNILMGAAHVSDSEFLRAAKTAGVDRFVSQSPLGYDMPVGERGEILSSGQRQAVILARSLVAHPSVLCLDEPSAGVDNGFERDLIGNLRDYVKDKTLLLVTHRLPMLQLVDRLIVLDRGRIVADGPKEEVMQALRENQDKHDNSSKSEE
jgi:ATP-binding cassette, subfamily C, bacterial LapB